MLYFVIALYVASKHGWLILLLFIFQFALIWVMQYQVTALKRQSDELTKKLEEIQRLPVSHFKDIKGGQP